MAYELQTVPDLEDKVPKVFFRGYEFLEKVDGVIKSHRMLRCITRECPAQVVVTRDGAYLVSAL
jgi:hypothetical protein